MLQDDPRTKTVRILSLDGGGIRGYFSACFLEKLCQDPDFKVNPSKFYESFDLIVGTSIGGIQALGYAYGKSPTEIKTLLRDHASDIFSTGALDPLAVYKLRVIMGLSSSNSFYEQAPLKEALNQVFDDSILLGELPGKVIVTSWDASADKSYLFSNITGFEPFLSGSSEKIIDAALATSAAPLYFPPLKVNHSGSPLHNHTLIDGGVFQNNPTMIGYSVGKRMFPLSSRFCVLSVGTGEWHDPFVPTSDVLLQPAFQEDFQKEWTQFRNRLLSRYPEASEWLQNYGASLAPTNVQYLFYLLNNVFIPGPGELTDSMMNFFSQDLFEDLFYYRFQTCLPSDKSALDDPSIIDFLERAAQDTYDQDRIKIENFIKHFSAV